MACISKLQKTKDGSRFWKIQVSQGRGLSPLSTRFYWPEKKNGDPVSEKKALDSLQSFAAEFERKCKAGEIVSRKETALEREKLKTVKEYAEGVYMARKNLELAETTRSSYQMILDKYIYPQIGAKLISEVSPAELNKLLFDFQISGKALSYSKQLYVVLNGVFSSAYRDGSIADPVMLRVEKPKQGKDSKAEQEQEKALSADMLNYVLDCLAAEPLKWQVYITLAADTGARRGELIGLQWPDIDTKGRSVTISRNVQYTPQKGVYITSPKNGKMRVVDIGPDTVKLLEDLQKQQKAEAEAFAEKFKTNVINYSPWVFNQDNSPLVMHPDSPTRYFKKFGERYGVKNFHPHLLRHTSASLAITEGGADVVSVSQRLGHSDTAVTLRMYSHASADSVRRAGQSVRDVLKKARKKKKSKSV